MILIADVGTAELQLKQLIESLPATAREPIVTYLVQREHVTEECALWLLGRRDSPYPDLNLEQWYATLADTPEFAPIIVN